MRRTLNAGGARAAKSESRAVVLTGEDGRPVRLTYTLIRSPKRRTYTIVVKPEGDVVLRGPVRISDNTADQIILDRQEWVLSKVALQKERAADSLIGSLSDEEKALLEKKYRSAARILFAERVRFYEPMLPPGHRPAAGIRIASQKTRWGSCSYKGTLSFNWRLMMAPPEVLDYVVVHELCHLCEMNHSAAFWSLVESILPDWKVRRKWLSDNGQRLLF